MLGTYTIIEILLSLAVLILAWYELSTLLTARREGRTKNISRVVTQGGIIVLAAVYAVLAWRHWPLERQDQVEPFGALTVPWVYLALGGLLAVLAGFEALSMFRARTLGRTKNISRLISYLVTFMILLAMFGLALLKWENYLERLDAAAASETVQSRVE